MDHSPSILFCFLCTGFCVGPQSVDNIIASLSSFSRFGTSSKLRVLTHGLRFFKKISATTVVEDLNFVRDQYANFKEDGMKRDTSTLHRPTVVTILMWLQREKGVAVWVSIRKPFACLLVPGHHR